MKHLWFIFCKGDLMLEKLPNGSFSIPEGNQPPIATKDWTHVLNVSPMD
ncbi:MAG: NADH pyrophosphatase, partial [Prevotella salivae]|nr:NADH pyrophosphatase [Segatella salivae]